jgi:pilus assembly protein Flp/PilA
MNTTFLLLSVKLQSLLREEDGQDLIEYVLVAALIALGATAGMNALATAINNAFLNVSSSLASNV